MTMTALDRPTAPSVWGHATECRDRVLEAVGRYYDVPIDLLLGRERTWPLDDARGVAMYLMWTDCALSADEIARTLGRTRSVVGERLKAVAARERLDRATGDAIGGSRALLGHERRRRRW